MLHTFYRHVRFSCTMLQKMGARDRIRAHLSLHLEPTLPYQARTVTVAYLFQKVMVSESNKTNVETFLIPSPETQNTKTIFNTSKERIKYDAASNRIARELHPLSFFIFFIFFFFSSFFALPKPNRF